MTPHGPRSTSTVSLAPGGPVTTASTRCASSEAGGQTGGASSSAPARGAQLSSPRRAGRGAGGDREVHDAVLERGRRDHRRVVERQVVDRPAVAVALLVEAAVVDHERPGHALDAGRRHGVRRRLQIARAQQRVAPAAQHQRAVQAALRVDLAAARRAWCGRASPGPARRAPRCRPPASGSRRAGTRRRRCARRAPARRARRRPGCRRARRAPPWRRPAWRRGWPPASRSRPRVQGAPEACGLGTPAPRLRSTAPAGAANATLAIARPRIAARWSVPQRRCRRRRSRGTDITRRRVRRSGGR